jgi:hypothetical protein
MGEHGDPTFSAARIEADDLRTCASRPTRTVDDAMDAMRAKEGRREGVDPPVVA